MSQKDINKSVAIPYNDYGTWIRKQFQFKVQKISVSAGFTCPNRDGTLSYGGCAYCNNSSFTPGYCNETNSITEQIKLGKEFFARKYPEMKYLVYFQSYTNTYSSIEKLKTIYNSALNENDVVGLVIGTRPDCITKELADLLDELNKKTFLIVELGMESTNNKTLEFVNRGHTFEQSVEAVEQLKKRNIIVGAHFIVGLPGEDYNETLRQAKLISHLNIDIIKLHQLQIVKGTRLENEYNKKPFKLYSLEEYIELTAQYIRFLPQKMIVERFISQTPANLLIAPKWGIKNYEFTAKLIKHMNENNFKQGELFGK